VSFRLQSDGDGTRLVLEHLRFDQGTQETCHGLAQLAARTRRRADTTLALLDDLECAQGQAALEQAAREEADSSAGPQPVLDTLHLLVLRAAGLSPAAEARLLGCHGEPVLLAFIDETGDKKQKDYLASRSRWSTGFTIRRSSKRRRPS
jgi:hypothetical protein